MLKKFVFVLKYLGIATGVLVGVISCENDFKNVGVDIVDNNVFSTNSHEFEVIAYSKNIVRNQSNNLNHYLFGVQNDDVFGTLEASIVSQLTLPESNPDFGLNAVIDSVIVDIPYLSTLQTDENSNGTPKFELDSIWTDGANNFQLSIYELGTYLNSVDPEDPTELKKYFSDQVFLKINPTTPFYNGLIEPSAEDTTLIVKRYKHPSPNYPNLTTKEVYQTDTINEDDNIKTPPSLKIPLDKALIKTIIQDNAASSDLASNSNFQHFFRGLYFEVLENGDGNEALMTLSLDNAKMTIYYSFDEIVDEGDDEDLNGNGITDEDDVAIRTPEDFVFELGSIMSNIYTRDYTGDIVENYIDNPDLSQGEELLFVQGAAGTNAVIKLFGEDANGNDIPDELETLRENNWLINDAQLTFYIASDNATNWIPQRLFLYNIGEEENTQILDALNQDAGYLGGTLIYDDDDVPLKYTFHITDFITELSKLDTELVLYDLGLKVFDDNDVAFSVNDTEMRDFNSNPKGLSLIGNLPETDEKRIKLEIFYSEKN